MGVSEILREKLLSINRGFTFVLNEKKYTYYDIIIKTDRVCDYSTSIYRIKKRIYVLLKDVESDFEILDYEYVKTHIKGNYYKSYSKFNIKKKTFFDKLYEKYGDEYMLKIYEKNIETDLINYIDENLFYKKKILFFDDKLYMSPISSILKNKEISRYYKLIKLKNKIQCVY